MDSIDTRIKQLESEVIPYMKGGNTARLSSLEQLLSPMRLYIGIPIVIFLLITFIKLLPIIC